MSKHKKRKVGRKLTQLESDIKLESTVPAIKLNDYTVFIYGPPKVGKTRLASEWPNSVFIATEIQGIKAIKAKAFKCSNWYEVRGAVSKLIKKYQGEFQTVIFDTIDLGFKYCMDYCGEVHGFEHPSDEAWGKGWNTIANEITEQVLRLFTHGFMPLFVSHSKTTEIRTPWETRTKTEPTLPYTARRVILPLVDIILLMESKHKLVGSKRRIIRTLDWSPSPDNESGERTGFLPKNKIITVEEGSGYKKLSKLFRKGVKEFTGK